MKKNAPVLNRKHIIFKIICIAIVIALLWNEVSFASDEMKSCLSAPSIFNYLHTEIVNIQGYDTIATAPFQFLRHLIADTLVKEVTEGKAYTSDQLVNLIRESIIKRFGKESLPEYDWENISRENNSFVLPIKDSNTKYRFFNKALKGNFENENVICTLDLKPKGKERVVTILVTRIGEAPQTLPAPVSSKIIEDLSKKPSDEIQPVIIDIAKQTDEQQKDTSTKWRNIFTYVASLPTLFMVWITNVITSDVVRKPFHILSRHRSISFILFMTTGWFFGIPGTAWAHQFAMQADQFVVNVEPWSAVNPAENTLGGVARDILHAQQATGQPVGEITWGKIEDGYAKHILSQHAEIKDPNLIYAGKTYHVEGVSPEAQEWLLREKGMMPPAEPAEATPSGITTQQPIAPTPSEAQPTQSQPTTPTVTEAPVEPQMPAHVETPAQVPEPITPEVSAQPEVSAMPQPVVVEQPAQPSPAPATPEVVSETQPVPIEPTFVELISNWVTNNPFLTLTIVFLAGVAITAGIIYIVHKYRSVKRERDELKRKLEEREGKLALVEELEERVKEDESKIAELDTKLKDQNRQVQELTQREEQIQKELEAIKTKLEKPRPKVPAKEEIQIQALQAEIEGLLAQKDTLNNEVASLESRRKDLEVNNEKLTGKLTQLSQRKNELTNDIARLEEGLGNVKSQIAERKKELVVAGEAEKEALTRQIHSLGETKSNFEAEIQKLIDSRDSLERDIAILSGKKDSVVEDLTKLQSEVKELDRRLGALTSQTEELRKEKEVLEDEIARLEEEKGKLLSIAEAKTALEERLRQAEQEADKLRSKAARLEEEKEQYESRIAELQSQNQELGEKLASQGKAITELRGRVSALNEQIKRLTKPEEEGAIVDKEAEEAGAKLEEIKKLNAQIRKLSSQIEEKKQEFENTKKEKKTLDNEINNLTSERDNLNSQVTQFTQELQGLREQIESQNQALVNLRQQLKILTPEKEETQNEVERLKTEIQRYQDELAGLTEERTAIAQQLDGIRKDIEQARQQQQDLEAKIRQRGAKIESLTQKVRSLTAEREFLEESLPQLRQEKTRLEQDIATLREELEKKKQEAEGAWKKAEEANTAEAEERAKVEVAEKQRREAERQLAEANERIAEAKERAKAETEEARLKTEEQARLEAEERVRIEAEEKIRVEAEEKTRIEKEARERDEAEEKARLEAEERVRAEAEAHAREEARMRTPEYMIEKLFDNIPEENKGIWATLNNIYGFEDSKEEIKKMLVELANGNDELRKLVESLYDNPVQSGRIKDEDMVSREEYGHFKRTANLTEGFDKAPLSIEEGLRFTHDNREYRLVLAPRDILDLIGGYISADCTDPGFANGAPFLKYVSSHIRSPGFLKFRLYIKSEENKWTWAGNIYTTVAEDKKSKPHTPILLIDALQLPSSDAGPFETEPKPNKGNLPFKDSQEAVNVAEQVISTLTNYAQDAGFRQVLLGFVSNFFEPKGGLVKYFQEKYAKEYNATLPPLARENRTSKITPTVSETIYQQRLIKLGLSPVGVDKKVLDSFPRTDPWTWRGFARIWPEIEVIPPDRIEELLSSLENSDPKIRGQAVEILGRQGWEQLKERGVIEALLKRLDDSEPSVEIRVKKALTDVCNRGKGSAIEELMEIYAIDLDLREGIALVLGMAEFSPSVEKALIEILSSPESETRERIKAISAFMNLVIFNKELTAKARRVLEAVVSEDKDSEVRKQAQDVLRRAKKAEVEVVPEAVVPLEIAVKPPEVVKVALPSLLITDIDNALSDNIAEMFKDGKPRMVSREVIDQLLYLAEQGTLIALITSQSFAEVNTFFLSRIPKEKRDLLSNFVIYTSCSAQCWVYEPKHDNFILRYDKFKEILPDLNINDIAKALQAKLKSIKIDSEIISQDKIHKSNKVIIHERSASISIANIPKKKQREISDAISDLISDRGWIGAITSHKSSTTSIDVYARTIGSEFFDKSFGMDDFLELAKKHLNREILPNEILTIGYDLTDYSLDNQIVILGANNYSVGTTDSEHLVYYFFGEDFDSDIPERVNFFGDGGNKGWQRTNELLRRMIEGKLVPPPAEVEVAAMPLEAKTIPVEVESKPEAPEVEVKPEVKKIPYSLMLLDIDDTLSENMSGMFKDGMPRYVPDDVIKQLVSFAEQGVLIALITSQSLGEVKKFLISRIPKGKGEKEHVIRNFILRNFIIYPSSAADCWTYSPAQGDFDCVYDKFEEALQGSSARDVANEIQKDLKGPFGIGGLRTTIFSQADISICSEPVIHDRGAQISIANIPSDKLNQVIKKVERLIQRKKWPLHVTGIAKHSFHILVKDIDKSFGRKHFLQFAKERLDREIPASEILVVGNSFGQRGSDKGMVVAGAYNYSVGTKDNLPQDVKFFGKGGKRGWERTRELFRGIIKSTIKTFIVFLTISFLLIAMPNYASIYAQEVNRNITTISPTQVQVTPTISQGTTQVALQVQLLKIERLIQELDDKDWRIRRSATKALGEIGDPKAVDPLIKVLEDACIPDVRKAAAKALGEIGDPKAVDPLIKALDGVDAYKAAAEALGEIGDPKAVDPLIKVLKDEDRYVGRSAAIGLKSIAESSQDVLLLVRLLDVREFDVHLTAIERLGEVANVSGVEKLQLITSNEFKYCKAERQKAKEALEQIKKRVAPEEWAKATEKEPFNIKKYLKPAGAILAIGALFYTIASLTSYLIARIKVRSATKQGENQNKGIKLYFIGLIIMSFLIGLTMNACDIGYEVNQNKKEEIGGLVKNLGNIDKGWEAGRKLGNIGKPAVPYILKALEDSNEDVRRHAAYGIEEMEDSSCVEFLIGILQHEYISARYDAARALGKIGDKRATAPLVEALNDNSTVSDWVAVNVAVADALGEMRDRSAVPALIRVLNSDDYHLRNSAAIALGKIGDNRAIKPLVDRLLDQKGGVDTYILKALHELKWSPKSNAEKIYFYLAVEKTADGWFLPKIEVERRREEVRKKIIKIGAAAVVPLIEALSSKDDDVSSIAVEILGAIGDLRAVDPLIEVINKDKDGGWRKFKFLVAAIEALGKIKDPKATECLIKQLEHEYSSFRESAAIALGNIGDLRAVQPLIEALEDADRDVRKAAAEALDNLNWKPHTQQERISYLIANLTAEENFKELVKIGAPVIQPLIKKLLEEEDPNKFFQQDAAGVLIKIGPPAVEFLIEALEYKDRIVRKTVAKTLGEIGDSRAVEPLIERLSDSEDDVRKSAAEALGKIGNSKAVEPLIEIIIRDEDYGVRANAIMALGNIKDGRSITFLIEILQDKDLYLQDEALHSVVSHTLTKIDHKYKKIAKNVILIITLELSETYPKEIIDLLNQINTTNPEVIPTVVETLRDSPKFCLPLCGVSDESSTPALIEILKHEHWYIRKLAIETLGQIGDIKAVEKLQFIASNELKHSKEERQNAKEALEQIKKRVTPEEWTEATGKKPFNLKKYLKPTGIVLGIAALFYTIASLVSYTFARIRSRNMQKQQAQNKRSKSGQNILRSLFLLLVLSIPFFYAGCTQEEGAPTPSQITTQVALQVQLLKIERLIQELDDKDWRIRRSATDALVKIGKPAVDPLIKALGYEDWHGKGRIIYVAEALGEIADSKAVDPLIKALDFAYYNASGINRPATDALVKIGKPAVDPLIKALGDNDSDVREPAAIALGNIGDLRAVQPLIEALEDADRDVRKAAAEALDNLNWKPHTQQERISYLIANLTAEENFKELIKIGAPAIQPLIKTLGDGNMFIPEIALALGEIGDKQVVDPLIQALKDEDQHVREPAAIALGNIGDERAVKALIEAFDNEEHSIYSAYFSIVVGLEKIIGESGVETLEKIKSSSVNDLVKALQNGDSWVRIYVTNLLDKRGWKPSNRTEKINYYLARQEWNELVKIGQPAVEPLVSALIDKDCGICLKAIETLGQIGDIQAVEKLQFIASNEFKYNKQERQKAKEALEQIKSRVTPEEWTEATSECDKYKEQIKKYLKPAGVILAIGALFYTIASLTSYLIARIKARCATKQGENQDKGTKLYSIAPIIPLSLVIGGIAGVSYGLYKVIKKIKTPLPQRKSYLSFFKTIDEIITLRKSEKIDKLIVLRILRLGVKNRIGGFTLWFLASAAILGGLIIFNGIQTYLGALIFVVVVNSIGWVVQSKKGIKYATEFINGCKIAFRLLIYPVNYLIMANEYARSSALTAEHFYLLRRFKKEQGERMFDEVRQLARNKLGKNVQWHVLDMVINSAYKMSKKNKDIRDLLEIQVPVALELSASMNDFKANLAVVEKILTGPYDIKLIKDKQRFKAFFEKVGKDLMPANLEQTVETVGLLEHRLIQQGFNIEHFYDEIFRGMNKQTLNGATDIIFEIIRYGFFPTEQLISMAKATQNRPQLYRDWRQARFQIQSGNFDINNPLHVELEYSTCRRILDNSRIVFQQEQFKGYSYKDYMRHINDKGIKRLDEKSRAEIVYAAYEAAKLKEFIDGVKTQANSFGREVWVVPNLSLGRFSNVFIESELRLDDIDIPFAKIPSTPCHEDENYIDPRFMRSQVLHRIMSERPVIIVVDSSIHIDRYPDAYQGYLNLAMTLDDVISGGSVSMYAGIGGKDRGSIHTFRRTSSFKAARKTIQREYDSITKKDPALYSFYFWNPRGVKLKIREHRKGKDKVEPLDSRRLNGPAVIFVNTVLEDKDIPKEIKEKTGGVSHNPGYFDDRGPCKTEHLLFQIDQAGIHLADNMHEIEMRAIASLRGKKRKQKALSSPRAAIPGGSSKRVNVDGNLASILSSQSAIKIRRLIDELNDNNSKIQADAAAALGEYAGNETIAVALRKTSLDSGKKNEVRYWAVSSLGSLGVTESTLDLSKALLNDSSSMVRAEAARAIGKLGNSQAVPSLSEALDKNKKEHDVKREIIFALRNIRVNEVLPVLLRALKEDDDPNIRAMAAEAYLEVGREEVALESLKCLSDRSEVVRRSLAEGLGDIYDTLGDLRNDVVKSLCVLLLQDKSPMVRQKLAWALGQIGDVNALKAVETALRSERDNDVREMLVWAKEKLVKAKETITAGKKEETKITAAEKKKPTAQEAVQKDKPKIVTMQGVKIDLSKIRGFIFDLDDTLAPLAQPVPLSINEKLIKLLKAGKYVAIITTDIEENLEERVWSQIPPELRKNLYIYSNGGVIGFGFNDKGQKADYYRFALKLEDRTAILNVVNSVLKSKPFAVRPADYKVKIKLGRNIVKQRHDIAVAIQESLKLAGIDAVVSFQGSDHINIHEFEKADAAKKFLSKCSLGEENVLIVGNRARSFGGDRRLLVSFPKAVSINAGSTSPTIQKENPNIIQTEVKNLLAIEVILNIVTGEPLVLQQGTTVAQPATSYTDTEDESQMGIEDGLEAEADIVCQKYDGIKIGVIGATAPSKEYSPKLGSQLGRKLGNYISERGYVFTGGVAGIGVDVYKGICESGKKSSNRFFVLLPATENPHAHYGRVEVAHLGVNKFERRIGMGMVADVLIVLNGKGGTLHEAIYALQNDKKVIVLDSGGVASLLYNAKLRNELSTVLIREGLEPNHLRNIIPADIATIEEVLNNHVMVEERRETPLEELMKVVQTITEKLTAERIQEEKIIPLMPTNYDGMKPKSVILFADGVVGDFGFFDIEETLSQGFFKDNKILDGGSIVLYGSPEKCRFLEKMIRKANDKIDVSTIEKVNNLTESEEVEHVAKEAKRIVQNGKGIKCEFIGVIKSRTNEIVNLQDTCVEIGMPIVILSNDNGIYSFKIALTEAFNRKYSGDTSRWLCHLMPIRKLSEESAEALRKRILEEIEIDTKA